MLYDIRELTTVARTLRHWKKEIVNSFDRVDGQRISNGPIESVNSRIKVVKQNGNGYKNFERFKTRVIHVQYNHVHPHSYNNYKTPYEACYGVDYKNA